MSTRHKLELSASEKAELEWMRDHDAVPYQRERAAALLKIAAGASPHAVAKQGLLKVRDPDTVYSWLVRFRAEGIAGLRIRPGRGRKAAFSPSAYSHTSTRENAPSGTSLPHDLGLSPESLEFDAPA